MLKVSGNHFKVMLTQEAIDALLDKKLFFSLQPNRPRLKKGDSLAGFQDCQIEPYSCIAMGSNIFRNLGFASYSNSPLNTDIKIGRYCSIAPNVKIFGPNHPTTRISTHTFTYQTNISILQAVHTDFTEQHNPGGRRKAALAVPFNTLSMPVIENDVWIGQDVTLARGIRVGTGSIIAGGSMVLKDVPDYAVVGGNPAKIIKYRFDESLCAELLMSQWWSYNFSDFSGLDICNPAAFLHGLHKRIQDGLIKPYTPEWIRPYDIFKQIYGTS